MNALLTWTNLSSGQTLQLVEGDITTEETDAIVNAANQYLWHGAGVAGAILHRGGRVIEEESDAWIKMHGPVSHAQPAWTRAGNLHCRFVIHAVGPIWDSTQERDTDRQRTADERRAEKDAELAAAVKGSLGVADMLGLNTLAFPAISTGIFGFPAERAAGVFYKAILEYFDKPSGLRLVRLVLHEKSTVLAFMKVWHDHFPSKS